MTKVIAIANQKGGVAKTTTTSAFAAGLKKRGYRVLAIDLDPQGNLSDSVGADMYQSPTVYNLMRQEITAAEAVQHLEPFDIIPSNIMLASAEQEFNQTGKEHRIQEAISEIEENYDYILLDTPPSLGILTVNAFTYADEVIIPTTAGIFAANGINQLYITIKNVKKYTNPKISIAGILLTKYNPRSNINKDIRSLTEQLGAHIQTKVFDTFIRSSVVVEEAQANKSDLYAYNKNSTVAEDYETFVEEYLRGDAN